MHGAIIGVVELVDCLQDFHPRMSAVLRCCWWTLRSGYTQGCLWQVEVAEYVGGLVCQGGELR